MESVTHHEPEPLTDGTTGYWSRGFPVAWITFMGVVVLMIWADALGDAPPPMAVKAAALAMWGGFSTLLAKVFWPLKHVWLDGDELVVGDLRRGTRIHLREVREVKESRMAQVKMVTLKLSRPTPLGDSITFVPRGVKTFFFPLASSGVVAELRERRERLLSGSPDDRRLIT